MTNQTPRPVLNSIPARLFVANIESSCDFYTTKLGFSIEFTYGEPPFYGQVVRDQCAARHCALIGL